jgi:hypothetical protein
MWVSGQNHSPAALNPKKGLRYPLNRRLDVRQRLGGFEEEEICDPSLDSNLRPVHHLASRHIAWADPLEIDKKIPNILCFEYLVK